MLTLPTQLTTEQQAKLKKAEDLIGEVQVELLHADDKLPKEQRTENWRGLYSVRCDLARICFHLNGNKNIL